MPPACGARRDLARVAAPQVGDGTGPYGHGSYVLVIGTRTAVLPSVPPVARTSTTQHADSTGRTGVMVLALPGAPCLGGVDERPPVARPAHRASRLGELAESGAGERLIAQRGASVAGEERGPPGAERAGRPSAHVVLRPPPSRLPRHGPRPPLRPSPGVRGSAGRAGRRRRHHRRRAARRGYAAGCRPPRRGSLSTALQARAEEQFRPNHLRRAERHARWEAWRRRAYGPAPGPRPSVVRPATRRARCRWDPATSVHGTPVAGRAAPPRPGRRRTVTHSPPHGPWSATEERPAGAPATP